MRRAFCHSSDREALYAHSPCHQFFHERTAIVMQPRIVLQSLLQPGEFVRRLFCTWVTKVDVLTLEEAGPALDCDGLRAEPEPD